MTEHALEAIIFDVDGTLAETEEAHRDAFNRTFSEFGLDWRWSEADYKALLKVTGGKERLAAFMAEISYSPPDGGPSDAFIADLHRHKTAHYIAAVESGGVALRPGAAQLIDECARGGVRLAIATTTSLPNVTCLLTATLGSKSLRLFEVIAAGDAVAAKKPAPDIYFKALDGLGLAPRVCLAIEDSRNGLIAAHGAGLGVVITPSTYTQGEDFTGALLVTPDLAGLAEPPGNSVLTALGRCLVERETISD